MKCRMVFYMRASMGNITFWEREMETEGQRGRQTERAFVRVISSQPAQV